jgi:hypothetical protein
MPFLFLGERRSRKAVEMGVRWEHGNLAARPLFDALRAHGIDPEQQWFENLFCEDLDGPFVVRPDLDALLAAVPSHYRLVAMGNRVSAALRRHGIVHIKIVHPAARGRIRERPRYIAHVGEQLGAST